MTRGVRLPSVADLRQHALDLAVAFNVKLVEDASIKPEEARAHGAPCLTGGIVRVAPIIDVTTYAVALHELGHCAAPLGRIDPSLVDGIVGKMPPSRVLVAEEAAWEWAEYHALDWTDAMTGVRDFALATYRAAVEEQRVIEALAALFGGLGQTPAKPEPPKTPTVRVNEDAEDFASGISLDDWGRRR
jgi:hypothetical protein